MSAFHKQAVCPMRGRDFSGLEFLDLDQAGSPGPSQPKWLSPVVQATWWGCKWEKWLFCLIQQGKTLIHRLGTKIPSGEVRDLVGPCSLYFQPHCGLEG